VLDVPKDLVVTAAEPGELLSGVVYVVEGSLQMVVGGSTEILHPGDCACIDTDMTVTWGSKGKDRCQVLFVNASA